MVVLIRDENTWLPAKLTSWISEDELQRVLADAPELMPGCESSAVVREFRIAGVGSADLVCVHDTGAITLVEVKLAKNAEIRRAVVGQIFAYASGLSGTTPSEFGEEFAKRSGRSLADAITDVAGPDFSSVDFDAELAETLSKGRFRLIIVVDQITSELRAIVEYLNVHLAETVTIVALELGRVLAGETQVLVPKTYGAEIADRRERDAGVRRRWSAGEIEDAVSKIENSRSRELIERLLTHARDRGAVLTGGSGPVPSAGAYYLLGNKRRSIYSLYLTPDEPSLSLNLGAIRRMSEQRAHEVLTVLRRSNAFSGKLPTDDQLAVTKYPWVLAADLIASSDEDAALWEAVRLATEDESPLR